MDGMPFRTVADLGSIDNERHYRARDNAEKKGARETRGIPPAFRAEVPKCKLDVGICRESLVRQNGMSDGVTRAEAEEFKRERSSNGVGDESKDKIGAIRGRRMSESRASNDRANGQVRGGRFTVD